jgi:hypothetical protein
LAAQEQVKIKVISVRRDLVDIAHAGADELAAICEVLYGEERHPGSPSAILAIGALFRSSYGPLLLPSNAPATLDTILLRELLANTAIRPVVVDERAVGRADQGFGDRLITRAPAMMRAFDTTGHETGFAAEEQMSVIGLATATSQAGLALATALFGKSHEFGLGASVASGAYTSALFAIMSAHGEPPPEVAPDDARAPPGTSDGVRAPPGTSDGARAQTAALRKELKKQGYSYIPLGAKPNAVIAASLAQTRAAADFYLSGAAAQLAAAAIAAALRGVAVGPPEIVAALRRPVGSIMSAIAISPQTDSAALQDLPAQIQRRQYLLDRLSRIFDLVPDGLRYRLSALNEIWHAGASDAYVAVLTGGRESTRVAAYLERLAIAATKRISAMAAALANDRRMSRARLLVTIVEEKIGSRRMRDIVSALGAVARGSPGGRLAEFTVSSVALNEPAQVLALLTKNERALVEAEAANRLSAYASVAQNKCPHVKLLRRINAAPTAARQLEGLNDLTRVYLNAVDKKSRDASSWRVCRSCGQNAICPHLIERITLEARGAPYAEVRARLERFALRAGGSEAAYYCRICAEQLAAADVAGEESGRTAAALGRFGELGAGLRTRIWAIAINALQRVHFAVPTDERRFAGEAATALIPLIELASAAAVERRPARTRGARRSAAAISEASELREELSPRTELLAAIYVYAYILDALRGRASPSTFAAGRAGERASATAERMLTAITADMSSQIASLEDVSAEYLRAQFTAAYRAVQTSGAPTTAPDVAAEFAVMMMTIDPVYRYAATAARAVGDLPLELPTTSAASRQEFELVMGSSLTTLLARARAAARIPALAGLFAGRPGLSIPAGTIYEFWLKEPQVSLYSIDGMYSWSSAQAAAQQDAITTFYNMGEPSISIAPPKVKGGRDSKQRLTADRHSPLRKLASNSPEMGAYYEAWRLLVNYTTQVYTEAALSAFNTDLQRYRTAEDAMRLDRAYGSVWPAADAMVKDSQRFRLSAITITQLYDENGLTHDWGKRATFYYAIANAAPLELRGTEAVITARSTGALPEGAPLVDVGCATCGIRHSATGSLDPAKTQLAVRANSELVSFFLFYETRCPKGGLHSISGATCTQCSLELAHLTAVRTPGARAYYSKYVDVFAAERATTHALSKENRPTAEAVPAAPATPPEIAEWTFDYSIITDAAALVSTTPSVLEAVGATGGREFVDISEGRGAPSPPESPADPRITVADATARSMFANYLALRRTPIASPGIQAILLEAGVPAEEQATKLAELPDLGADYCYSFAAIAAARTPADTLSFAIQSYCQFAVTLAAFSPLGNVIAKNALNDLVRSVRRMSKPGVFDWAIFSGERELLEEDEGAPDQVGDIGEDVAEEGPEDESTDPFSGENIDYDTSEDNPNNALN